MFFLGVRADDESSEKRAKVMSLVAGVVFAVGWWIVIDAAVWIGSDLNESVDEVGFGFQYWLPCIFCLFSIFLMNSFDWEDINAVMDNSTASKARCLMFAGCFVGFTCIIAQVWILAEVWGGTNNPDQDVHGGVALLTCCITTFLSGVLVRVGTIGQEPGLGM